MKQTLRIYRTIGETRVGVIEGGKLVEVHIERDRDLGLPHTGDVFTGQVRRIDAPMGAAFVDLGAGEDGFFRFTTSPAAPRLTEGMRLDVRVQRAAESGKGPILVYKGAPTQDAPGVVEQRSLLERLRNRFDVAKEVEKEVPRLSELVETELAIPGGGTIAIEPTRALVAVDVDKGAQVSGLKAGQAAAGLIARQLRLRGLGGLVCIDFPNLRQPKQKQQLERAVQDAFADDPNNPKIAPLSRFGLIEMTRTRMDRSLDQLWTQTGLETQGLEALDDLLRAGRAQGGAKLNLHVPGHIKAWLDSTDLDWAAQLQDKIGARFEVVAGDSVSVEADR